MVRNEGLPFAEAFGLLKKGVMIYRRKWILGTRCRSLSLRPATMIPAIDERDYENRTGFWKPLQEDLFATDWGVVND